MHTDNGVVFWNDHAVLFVFLRSKECRCVGRQPLDLDIHFIGCSIDLNIACRRIAANIVEGDRPACLPFELPINHLGAAMFHTHLRFLLRARYRGNNTAPRALGKEVLVIWRGVMLPHHHRPLN